MATLVLAAAGGALGATMGGTAAGLSAAVIGRALGGTLGQALDQRLMGTGSQIVEQGRVERFRLTGASEGAAIARLYGRSRIGGQVIWASDFVERRSTTRPGGGKGGGGGAVRSYSYSVSVAIALCEGEISHVGRIWADGAEIDRDQLGLRVYTGTETQLPDPAIAAHEGNGNAPAFRGIAYVLFENLELAPFGNRVPQFSFEVARPDQAQAEAPGQSLRHDIRGVALIPGTGEYALATTPVRYETGPGEAMSANRHASSERTDIEMSLDALEAELPNCRSVSLVVSWFGDDLRCGEASIRPKIEQNEIDGTPMAWNVAGEDRATAARVPMEDGRPIYGGTPSDRSVVEAIGELRARGQAVMFYPFILMDQTDDNGLTDPWTGAAHQAAFPWRGRITLSRAPGQPGSPDGTAAARAEVAAFFGSAKASDFTVGNGSVAYSGPQEWSFRRFILHYAALCAAAGGVEAFCIGSEMRSLTQIRGADDSFPTVEELVRLAGEVRALLGAGTKIGYAADWSEYSGYAPADTSGDRFFHLDPLWAHPSIDFIGIDNYMPLSDWRDGTTHADADHGSIYDLEYLKENVAGGEGFDWYYASAEDAEAQRRLPITDGAYDEAWVHRVKDIRSWWSKPHFDRLGGIRKATATPWVPMSKPIWFTELGCAAIDKGTNEPNKFLDPKSSESALPRASTGARDDLIQVQYLRAMYGYWGDLANNPPSAVYGGPMVDMDFAHVWAWDARPYPWFPGLPEVWGDGENYARGHWLNGRMSSRTLSSVVAEICEASGLADPDVGRIYGLVRGYSITEAGSARSALQPLMLAYGFDASERDGTVIFRNRPALPVRSLPEGDLARHPDLESGISLSRAAEAELPERVRLSSLAADAGYEVQSSESSLPDARGDTVSQSDMNLVLTASEARAATERWLTECRIARDTVRFALPPSRIDLGPGDVVSIAGSGGLWRLDRIEQDAAALVEAVRIETGIYSPGRGEERQPVIEAPVIPGPLRCVFLDLPLLTGNEAAPHAPYVAVSGRPWPGEVAVYASATEADYTLNTLIEAPAAIGQTLDPLPFAAAGVFDRGPALRVRMPGVVLSSVSTQSLLAGANAIAIGTGAPREWEVLQFRDAELVGPDTYALTMRLRGQAGTDAFAPPFWAAGSTVVLLDGALRQIDLPASARGLVRTYRIGPASLPHSHSSFVQIACAATGVGLRPYSPCHLRGETISGATHRISWIRRTRIDGDAWDLTDVPVGEVSEKYELRVVVGGKVKRRIFTSEARADYTLAQRTADGVDGDYRIEVAQVSDRFGPGPFIGMTYHG